MSILKSIHGSSETHQTQPPTTTTSSFSIEMLDSSVQSLIKSWQRRQRWLHLLFTKPGSQDLQTFRAAWRTHLANLLESTWVHLFSIFLLVIDLLITILELSSSLLSSCEPNQNTSRKELSVFRWVGIGILGLLSAKTMGLVVGLGSSFFLRHPGYVMDGAVVIGALVLEGFLEKNGSGLVVVVSLWRVIRVVESAFELSDEAIEAQIEGIVCQFEALREENRRLLETIDDKDNTIQKLQEELDQYCQS